MELDFDGEPEGGEFDYVIAGAGSSGCVLASRLSEDPNVQVLLLEAGHEQFSPYVSMPLAYSLLRTKNLFDWNLQSEPEPGLAGRQIPVPRGKLLGGSSSINGMIYSRGHPADYDDWVKAGAAGWSYEEVLPYFRRSEANWRGESENHGGDGPLSVSRFDRSNSLTKAMHASAQRLGHPVVDDLETNDPDGFFLPDLTTQGGRRASAWTAYLSRVLSRKNLVIRPGSHATRVEFDGTMAIGISYLRYRRQHVAKVRREVILCLGTYGSPHLLMLSGIGPGSHLRELGITVLRDAPLVGGNLQDHVCIPMTFSCRKALKFGRQLRLDRFAKAAVQWQLLGKGPAASIPLTSIAYHHSRPDLDRPDLENIFIPTGLAARPWFPGWRSAAPEVLTSLNVALRPASRGTVRLASSDPAAPPRIVFNLLSAADDLERLTYSVHWTRQLMATPPLDAFVGGEVLPGLEFRSDEELETYARSAAGIGHDATSTCAIGTVVDPHLRVKGFERLRVVDASVMPSIIGGHTNAVAMMIGEKAADLLRSY